MNVLYGFVGAWREAGGISRVHAAMQAVSWATGLSKLRI